VGVVGRTSQEIRLRVGHRAWAAETAGFAVSQTEPGAMVNTYNWSAYHCMIKEDRLHATVVHLTYEWARDDDGDGVREVHINTLEGIWTGLRNFLRPFRGVNKVYLQQYAAVFEWSYNDKAVNGALIRALVRSRPKRRGTIAVATPSAKSAAHPSRQAIPNEGT
jgi:transposase